MLHQAAINELHDAVAEKEAERDDILEEIKNLNNYGRAPASDFINLHSRIHDLELEIEVLREKISSLEEEQRKHPNYKEYLEREPLLEERSISLSRNQGSNRVCRSDK